MLRRILPLVNRISGALLMLVGLYVGYYGLYEVRLLNASDANPQDAVITAAGRLQGALAGWVHQHGRMAVGGGVDRGSGAGRARRTPGVDGRAEPRPAAGQCHPNRLGTKMLMPTGASPPSAPPVAHRTNSARAAKPIR